jgi:hypothetical protein
MDLIRSFPGVVTVWVPFPFEEVLQGLLPSIVSMVYDPLHLIFFYVINEIRWRAQEVRSMRWCFMIG